MFWKLVREDVIGEPAELTSAWTQSEWGPRTLPLREYLLREFWAIFLDDRPFHSGSLCRHANVQPKAVFSCSMAVMDKIHGWEDEEKWMGSNFAACMWIYTKGAQTGGQILDRVEEEYVRKRKMSMMLCANWVCEGAFVNHEWVSSRTITQQEAGTRTRNAGVPEATDVVHYAMRELGMCRNIRRQRVGIRKHNCRARRRSDGQGFGSRNLYSVRGAVEYAAVFRAHTVKSNIERRRNKKRKIPRSRERGDRRSDLYALWRFAHTAHVHADNSACSLAQDTQKVECEQGNEGLGNERKTCAPALC